MKFDHTVKVAFSLNLWVENDQGHRVDAWILPVQCLFFWIPALLYKSLTRNLSPHKPASRRTRQPRRPSPWAWLFDLAGWKKDLPLIVLAGRLLLTERRFAAYGWGCTY
jgi:hypothetical protein